ncbi:MAG: type II secretion system secretin GspD [Acidobacteria bacterium]|nr:type II secretion system secretin GspD [Acidobacteriota bacterium]
MRIVRLRSPHLAAALAAILLHLPLVSSAQPPRVVVPPGFGPRDTPPQTQPAAPGAPASAAAPQAAPQSPTTSLPPAGLIGGLSLQNVSLTEVVDYLARQLKINYIIEKGIGGGVTLNTYGEVKDLDPRALLDTILRMNGAAMVQTGSIYRIVPLAELAHMPLSPEQDPKLIPDDDRAMLNLIFLKYANVEELAKLMGEFLGPSGKAWSYPPANLLLVLDSRRNMRRTMEMVALFDSDVLAKQRVRLFDIKNSRPTDLAKEMEGMLKSMSLSKELSSVKFVPVDRINTLIAVAPNPGVFDRIQEWISKLDVKVENAAGKSDNYVYRVRYGQASMLAMSIMMLYYSLTPGMGGYGMGMGGYGMGMGGYGMGGYGMGGYGMGMGGYGMGGYGMGGMGMGGYGMGGYGMGMGGYAGGPVMTGQMNTMSGQNLTPGTTATAGGAGTTGGYGTDMTGAYMGMGYGMGMGMGMGMRGPRVVPNVMDNSLLILATPDEYNSILKLLTSLDVPPRQVLIEARIFEIKLTGALSWGLNWYLLNKGQAVPTPFEGGSASSTTGRFVNSALNITSGWVLNQSKVLLAALNTSEVATKTKVLSTPSVIATDSIPASINVGVEVPTLTAQAVSGVQEGGSSLFANTVTNRKTGVNLNITARVNPSGVVTMQINQEVSSPAPPPVGGIQSPSFSNRSVNTQVTVQDGDTIAIGGIINETYGETSGGVPFLHRVPVVGYAFGNKSFNKERTELVIFFTPRVIYDTNELTEASDELMSRMKRVQKLMKQ